MHIVVVDTRTPQALALLWRPVTPEVPYHRLAEFLRDETTAIALWSQAYAALPMQMAGQVATSDIAPLISAVAQGMVDALPVVRSDGTIIAGDLVPGSPAVRDLEKATGFVGATLASLGATGFEVAAAVLALRNVLADVVEGEEKSAILAMLEWLCVLAMDSFASAKAAGTREKLQQELEQGTPVVLLPPGIAAALLVGTLGGVAVDAILSRLLLVVVRVGAKAAIIDAAGAPEPDSPAILEALRRFASHRKIRGKVRIIGSGLSRDHETSWAEVLAKVGTEFETENQFAGAVARAIECSGYELRSRSPS